ncbi:MAG: alpha/beta hydrolase, partial [Chloroflexi bacterium]|nr:alpha/beta hydrolase [Chloroflexota bacterium]
MYVLIHGAARGAWLWDKVAPILEERNLKAYALDLPGHGNRQAERAGVTMQTYVDDVKSFIVQRDLRGVVLVGHSMSGVVISKLAERIPDRISHLVYLAAIALKDGEAIVDHMPPERVRIYEQMAAESGDNSTTYTPEMTANFFLDASPEDRAWALSKLCRQPFAPFAERMTFPTFYTLSIPRTYVLCTLDQSLSRDQCREFARRLGVGYVELNESHDPM